MAEADEVFVAVEESGTSDGRNVKLQRNDSVESFEAESTTPANKTTANRRLGSMRKKSTDDGKNLGTYDDGDLKEIDMVPMEEQDAEHNWEALNQRILERMNEEHKWMVQHRIIHPMGKFRKRWDAMQVLLLAYVAMLVPCEYSMLMLCPPAHTHPTLSTPPQAADRSHAHFVAQIGSASTTTQQCATPCSGLTYSLTLTLYWIYS